MGVYISDATDAESDEPERWMSPIDVRIDPVFAHTKGSGFQTVRPEEDFRRESLAAARRQNNLLLVEPYLSLESWESNGPRNALKAEVAGDKILALLDRMIRKSKKRSRDEQKRDRDANVHENERYVAGDRTAAFDAVMPLDGEILCTWNASLRRKISQYGPAAPYFEMLTGFLQRAKAGRKFSELSWREKSLLGGIVEKIVQADA